MCGLEAFARDVGAAVLALLVERIEQMVGFFLGELDDFFHQFEQALFSGAGQFAQQGIDQRVVAGELVQQVGVPVVLLGHEDCFSVRARTGRVLIAHLVPGADDLQSVVVRPSRQRGDHQQLQGWLGFLGVGVHPQCVDEVLNLLLDLEAFAGVGQQRRHRVGGTVYLAQHVVRGVGQGEDLTGPFLRKRVVLVPQAVE